MPKLSKIEQYHANIAALPETCIVKNPHTGESVVVKRDEQGFYPITSTDLRPEQIDNFNRSVGIGRAQEMAMLHGSMFGFDTPAANPSYWEYEAFYEELRAEFPPSLARVLVSAFKDYKRGGISLAQAKGRAAKMMSEARGEAVG